jgi:acetoacetate decarboxylase
VAAVFTTSPGVAALLPEGLTPALDPPVGAVWVARYGFSTAGPYDEVFSTIQVRDRQGDVGLYVPYIYVTNDAAMAAGREVLGAPKKLATIQLGWNLDVIQGTLERPLGKRLVTVTMKPDARFDSATLELLRPSGFAYSVRHLPAIGGKGEVTQLVKWVSETRTHKDAFDEEFIFTGPTSVTSDSSSAIDPVHKLPVREMVAGIYTKVDMRLRTAEILSGIEARVPEAAATR